MLTFQNETLPIKDRKNINYTELCALVKDKASIPKNTVALKINNNQIVDLQSNFRCEQGIKIQCITPDDDEYLDIMRHSAAHVLAQAVKAIYPKTKVAIGPTINNGFYYDFDFDASDAPKEEDLAAIENKMQEIIKAKLQIQRKVIDKKSALKIFTASDEEYKVEIISRISDEDDITMYYQGDFYDLCRGPHLSNTEKIGAFKLTQITRAYWAGDSTKKQLWRIYGTAWRNAAEMKSYFIKLEEAKKRYHVTIGQKMDLFHFQEEAPGAVFWHPNGWFIFQSVLQYIRRIQDSVGYTEISTPEVMTISMWQSSGHWEKFRPQMFTTQQAVEKPTKMYALKPMNCPGTIQIFRSYVTSYRDLPIKLSEFGKVFRYEPPGALHGLMRLRAFTQDDAHIFCTKEQVGKEIENVCKLVFETYKHFGFENITIKISTRPEQRVGSDEIWDNSEDALIKAAKSLNLEYSISEGDGAFYGPKIEFTLKDAIDREWQLGTVQVDFNLPQRFDVTYTSSEGNKEHPIMIHRAIFGSIERFIGVLIEHYNGYLPISILRHQIVILAISDAYKDYAISVYNKLLKAGIRPILDQDNDTLGYKIRKYTKMRMPMIGIVGEKEVNNKTISIRHSVNSIEETVDIDIFISNMAKKLQ